MSDEPELDDEPAAPPRPTFLVTKKYRRFAEFAEACRRDRYIGVCYGPPGVGTSLTEQRTTLGADIPPDLADCHSLVSTPKVATAPRRLGDDLMQLSYNLNDLVRTARQAAELGSPSRRSVVELLIVD